MIFLPVLFIAVFLYLKEKYVGSVLLFFFFLTNGFQLIPLEFFQISIGISKPMDFALLYVLILFICKFFKHPKLLIKGRVAKTIILLLGFVITGALVDGFLRDTPWDDILRTTRFFFIILSYFLFIRLPVQTIDKIFRILFIVVIVQSVLFILQVLLDEVILTGYIGNLSRMEEVGFSRFRNMIPLLPYFVFYALFKNPYAGSKKYISTGIVPLAFILPMYRGMMIALALTALLGVYFYSGYKGIVKYFLIGLICLLPLSGIIFPRFEKAGTIDDIKSVLSGSYKNNYIGSDATFSYRIAHFYERLLYVVDEPVSFLFGVGYMTEVSQTTYNTFDFQVGLKNEDGGIVQLDTADISWSLLVVRFGILGSVVFLIFFFTLVSFFWKRRKIKLHVTPLAYLLYLLVLSVDTTDLFIVWIYAPMIFLNIIQSKKIESQCLQI